MNRPRIAPRQVAALLALACGLLTALALSAPNARQQALSLVAALAQKPEAQRVAADTLAKAKDALRRADQMRASGDHTHAALLEETALEWAIASEQLDRTSQREKELFELQSKTTELETKVFRAQALVEQTVARRARAEEALRKLDRQGAKP